MHRFRELLNFLATNIPAPALLALVGRRYVRMENNPAMKRLYEELGDKVALDIVGFYDDEACQTQAEELIGMGAAVFHGFQSEPRPYYAGADCVVLASYHEGMSNVLLEAAATGRPVNTSDIYGCREAVDEGVTGLLCTVKDADSLYAQMKKWPC